MRASIRFFFVAAILLGAVLFASDSRAGATVDLLFIARNGGAIAPTPTVAALPGDTLTMAVRMRNDQALTAAVFSIEYDLDGDDELDVVSASQWIGVFLASKTLDVFTPVAPLSPTTATFVGPFQGFSSNTSLPRTLPPTPGGYQMGTVVWKVNSGVNDDGADIVSFLKLGIDGFGDAFFNQIDGSVQLNAATVNLVPEPDTAALLGLGLVGLVLMRRRRIPLTLAVGLVVAGVGLPSGESRAGATVDLLFVERNGGAIAPTPTVAASPGDTLMMVVRMRNDEPLTAAVFSLNYDLDGDDELDVVSAFQWVGVFLSKGTDVFTPIAPLSPATPTFVGSFQGVTSNLSGPRTLPPTPGGYQMGTVVWRVTPGVNNDGVDLISGLLNPGVDVFIDARLEQIISRNLRFNAATVNLVPEPGTAGLLGLGLVGLVMLRRRGLSRGGGA